MIFKDRAFQTALAGGLAMATAMGIGRFAYTPILPFMLSDQILSPTEAGIAAGCNFLGYLLGAIFAAHSWFAPRRRTLFFAALFLSVVITMASGMWGGVLWFYGLRFLAGVSSAFAMIFISTIVMQTLQREGRGSLISLHFAGVGFGICLSAVVISLFLGHRVNWQVHWQAIAVVAAILFLCVRFLLPQDLEAPTSQAGSGAEEVSTHYSNSFWLLLIGYGFFGFGYSISATFINTMARADPALTHLEPYIWLIVGLSALPSIWLWYQLGARIGLLAAYFIACFTEALGVLIFFMLPGSAGLVISGMLLGGTFIAVTAIGLSKSRELMPFNPAKAIALMTASFGLGQMIGPVIAGRSFDMSGSFSFALGLAIIALLLTCLLTWFGHQIEKKIENR